MNALMSKKWNGNWLEWHMTHLVNQTQSQRQRRVAMIIHRALSEILLAQGYKITINEVILTKDLRHAEVFVLPQEKKGDKSQLALLKKNQGRIKRALAPKLQLKYMPDLRFRLDENFFAAQKLDQLLS